MRNLAIIPLLFFPLLALEAQERWLLGAGITYCTYISEPGINLNVTYRLIKDLHIGPDFSALLVRETKESGREIHRKELDYNFNAHYLFGASKALTFYPLTGINVSKVTYHVIGDKAEVRYVTSVNLGAGLEWELDRTRLFFESKYVPILSKLDFTMGVVFELMKNKKSEE